MNNKITATLAAAVVAALLVACGRQESGESLAIPHGKVVKIGQVGPASGPLAYLGRDHEYAARMAIDDLNAQGVMIDGSKVTLQLIPEDYASDPRLVGWKAVRRQS